MEKQVHSFLYQNQLIASGQNQKSQKKLNKFNKKKVAHPLNVVSTECGQHLHECM